MSEHHITEYTVGQVIEQLAFDKFEVQYISPSAHKLGSAKANNLQSVISVFIKMIKSHHILDSTVFYLAKKSYNQNHRLIRGE